MRHVCTDILDHWGRTVNNSGSLHRGAGLSLWTQGMCKRKGTGGQGWGAETLSKNKRSKHKSNKHFLKRKYKTTHTQRRKWHAHTRLWASAASVSIETDRSEDRCRVTILLWIQWFLIFNISYLSRRSSDILGSWKQTSLDWREACLPVFVLLD